MGPAGRSGERRRGTGVREAPDMSHDNKPAGAEAFDLLPMAIGLGHGSEANAPLARAMLGGVIGGSLLTLLVLPLLPRRSAP